jgi:hypothetical protein
MNIEKMIQDWQYVIVVGSIVGGVALLLFGETLKGLGVIFAGILFFPSVKSPQWLKMTIAALVVALL